MNKKQKKKLRQQVDQQSKLEWVLREWDCHTIEMAIKEAQKDSTLHYALRECGIKF